MKPRMTIILILLGIFVSAAQAVLRYHAQVNPGDATSTGRIAYDVFFVGEPLPTAKANPAGSNCQVPAIKTGMLATTGGGSR
jgi:hypothetical protein